MQEMELKPSIITLLFLFFILSLPNSSQGAGAGANSAILESEIYEIDYRGPETHSYVPPPDRTGLGGHGRPFVHYHGPGRTNDGTDRP
ncbi:uncharacterized protein LOC122081617 isoform X2 [Macadamia integrifolia]|uniref:uncharacterized protein LOC122081617 isoform X2 n=1 Tax=Macadamia integrifolia TaxID=60698 RepID=UPI001C4E5141|nr:uncharacterized protein LOC122081617 isoform X2 [Macadamia integrifolia]